MFNRDHAGLKEFTHGALRIVAGFLFVQHGAQKLFGVLGGDAVESVMSRAGIAGSETSKNCSVLKNVGPPTVTSARSPVMGVPVQLVRSTPRSR